jgi:hypothetical protein
MEIAKIIAGTPKIVLTFSKTRRLTELLESLAFCNRIFVKGSKGMFKDNVTSKQAFPESEKQPQT